jgi:hypothetical protein
MRSTPELIAELEQEAKNHWYVAMVVGFENSTIFVQAEDKDRLAMLNSAIQAGGIPVGLIATDKSGTGLAISVRCYPEYQNSEEFDAENYLTSLAEQVAGSLGGPDA